MLHDNVGKGEELHVRFDSPSDGWLGIEFHAGDVTVVETFSHIYPALRDLCSALCDVLNGVTARPVVFLLEPAELELLLRSHRPGPSQVECEGVPRP